MGEDPLLPGDVTPYPQLREPPLPEPAQAEATVPAYAADGQGQLALTTALAALADPAGAGSPHGTRRSARGSTGCSRCRSAAARTSDARRGRS